jgi:hypothetical protein
VPLRACLIEAVVVSEFADILAQLVQVLLLVVALQNIVSAIGLVCRDEVRVVDAFQRDQVA